ncbi:MAG: sulfotransferase [Chloroflexota bacterium]
MAKFSADPVFVGGCDRSGTTLLGAILGSHQQVVCVPEAQFVLDGYLSLGKERKGADLTSQEILQKIKEHPRFQLWNIQLREFPKSEAPYSEMINFIIGEYADQTGETENLLWIDHVPANIKHVRKLLEIFPKAKFVHLVRDGRAVASSLLSVSWGPRTIDRAANFWVNNLAYGLAAEKLLNEREIIQIRYEDLLSDPEREIKRLCEFLGLQFEAKMLQASGLTLPMYSQKDHKLVGRAIDSSRISAWEHKLSSRQIHVFESLTGDMLEYLGYPLKFEGRKTTLRYSELGKALINMILEFFQAQINQLRLRYLKK